MGSTLTNSLLSDNDDVTLYYAIYTAPYSGKIDAVKYTTIYPKEEVYLTDHSGYFALTVYALNPIPQSAELIKQEANKTFIKAKEDVLKDAIDKEIDFNFKSGRDEISDNNLLL